MMAYNTETVNQQHRDSKPTIQNKSGGGMRDNKDPPKASHSH